jgi:magnesium-transporting ATPase (P-type)
MDVLYSIQRSLFTVYNLLPVVSMITLFTLGLALGNVGMISIWGIMFLTTLGVGGLKWGLSKFSSEKRNLFSLNQLFTGGPGPTGTSDKILSYWIINITLLFTALVLNAWQVYKINPINNNVGEIDSKIRNRKTRCIMIMVLCSLIGLALVGYRWFMIEGFSFVSTFAVAIGISIGAIWSAWIETPTLGLKGNMDIFGISQQLVAVKATDFQTMCELKAA